MSNQKNKYMYKNVIQNQSSSDALNQFVNEFSKIMEIPFDEFKNGVNGRVTETLIYQKNKLKNYKEDKYGEYFLYENDVCKLQFYELTESIVELFWIEVNYKNKGMGTLLLNKILDAADEVNVEIKLIPIPLHSCEFDFESKRRLRNWYESFGFRSKSTLSPAMYYSPNK